MILMVPNGVQGSKGTPTDKLRLALVFLLTCDALPSDGDYERVTTALAAAGADMSALAYVRRMRRMNLTGRGVTPPLHLLLQCMQNPWALTRAPRAACLGCNYLAAHHCLPSFSPLAHGSALLGVCAPFWTYLETSSMMCCEGAAWCFRVAVERPVRGRPPAMARWPGWPGRAICSIGLTKPSVRGCHR